MFYWSGPSSSGKAGHTQCTGGGGGGGSHCSAFIGDGDTYVLLERSKLFW